MTQLSHKVIMLFLAPGKFALEFMPVNWLLPVHKSWIAGINFQNMQIINSQLYLSYIPRLPYCLHDTP